MSPSATGSGPRLWICSPVYYDVPSYTRLRDELAAISARELPDHECHFVVIDDSGGLDPEMGSLAAAPGVTVIQTPFSLGHQRALVYALRKLYGQLRDDDVVVTLDADGEDKPDDLPRLLTALRADPSNRRIALAARTKRRETLGFRLLYRVFTLIFVAATGTIIRSGNFAAYRGWIARNLIFHPYFDLCYSSSLVAFNLSVERVPCARGVRYAGRSKMTYSKLIMHGLRMLMPFADRMAIRGLIVFSVLILATVGFGIWVVATRLFTDLAIPGWATYTLLLAIAICGIGLTCILLLFTLFVQMQSLSMSRLDAHLQQQPDDRPA